MKFDIKLVLSLTKLSNYVFNFSACLPVSKILPYAEGRKKENFYQKINNALHQAIHIADEKYERQMKLLPLGS